MIMTLLFRAFSRNGLKSIVPSKLAQVSTVFTPVCIMEVARSSSRAWPICMIWFMPCNSTEETVAASGDRHSNVNCVTTRREGYKSNSQWTRMSAFWTTATTAALIENITTVSREIRPEPEPDTAIWSAWRSMVPPSVALHGAPGAHVTGPREWRFRFDMLTPFGKSLSAAHWTIAASLPSAWPSNMPSVATWPHRFLPSTHPLNPPGNVVQPNECQSVNAGGQIGSRMYGRISSLNAIITSSMS
mmetsp:Transcript_55248/g.167964  ORF Transcript_55248/g.167964 Transcript_55248/m.167964 type:complete len:245 (+) Transcript_55248:79-813(+)